VRMLAEARTLDEIGHIRAMALAAEHYARAEKLGDEAVRYAQEIRTRAARKAGELLRQMAERGERRKGEGEGRSAPMGTPKLDDLGITRKQSARWQQLAAIPEPVFEKLVRGEKPTEARVARAPVRVAPTPKGYDPVSLERRGAFRRLCRDLVALGSARETAREFSEHDHDGRLLDTAREAATWLADFLAEWTEENP
jgi:hypothetical protein